MIAMPNRMADLARAVESGEPVDLRRLSVLQALDIASVGQQFVEQAIKESERRDNELEAFIR